MSLFLSTLWCWPGRLMTCPLCRNRSKGKGFAIFYFSLFSLSFVSALSAHTMASMSTLDGDYQMIFSFLSMENRKWPNERNSNFSIGNSLVAAQHWRPSDQRMAGGGGGGGGCCTGQKLGQYAIVLKERMKERPGVSVEAMDDPMDERRRRQSD